MSKRKPVAQPDGESEKKSKKTKSLDKTTDVKAEAEAEESDAAPAAGDAKDEAVPKTSSALAYLREWAEHEGKSPWKFNKSKQVWLLQHAFDKSQIPPSDFKLLLRYLAPLKGLARERTLADGKRVLNEWARFNAKAAEAAEAGTLDAGHEEQKQALYRRVKRARKLVRVLSDQSAAA